MRRPTCFLLSAVLTAGTGLAVTAPEIVERHSIVLDKPVGEPTQYMARGPLLGNGDVGVMQSGPAEELVYHFGKNDFWSTVHQAPIAVGQLRILTPALQGAKFETVSDLRLAEIRGDYANGDAHLSSRAWVDANRNLFFVELSNSGTKPLPIALRNVKGATALTVPAKVPAAGAVKIGAEQAGGGRWFFQGDMADVAIADRALNLTEVTRLAKAPRKHVEAFDGKTAKPFAAPAISNELTVSAWIKASGLSNEANYLFSQGEWNQGYSLGLSNGQPRFAIGGFMLQDDARVPLNQWVHLAGVFDGKQMTLWIDGKVRKSAGTNGDDGREFLYDPDPAKQEGRTVGLATRVVGGKDHNGFTLQPGQSAVVATAILSDLDAKGGNPLDAAKALVGGLTADQIARRSAAHREWWAGFWNRSFIEIPDKTIEQSWDTSRYVMGSCSRSGKIAPGLWGNWLTSNNPAWHGDFHLNYNFQAPFYGLYSANHADTTQPFYDAMNQSIPRGRKIAAARGWKGIHLPVSIGPWGMCPEGDHSDWGQRSNTAFAALLYIWHWQYTRDLEWLKSSGYTYLRETAAFWEDYLKFENGRYVIYNDSIHEGSGADMNPLLSLGLVRTLFKNLIPMSEALEADADKRAKWRDIVEKLSDFPLQEKNGKTVFRYSEKGTAWWDGNTLGIQHIYPAGAIGLDSSPELLKTSHHMIDAMSRWRDYNGSSSWYTACARVGYDPNRILTELRGMYDRHSLPNKLLNFGGGGIENVSPALAITEMLMQSHDGVIRVFPCWPKDQDARFGSLRAVGAFLVSGEIKGGQIGGVELLSEKGGDCVVVNPWPGHEVQVLRANGREETAKGDRFTLKTAAGETLELKVK